MLLFKLIELFLKTGWRWNGCVFLNSILNGVMMAN